MQPRFGIAAKMPDGTWSKAAMRIGAGSPSSGQTRKSRPGISAASVRRHRSGFSTLLTSASAIYQSF